jgi:hypothetical protein
VTLFKEASISEAFRYELQRPLAGHALLALAVPVLVLVLVLALLLVHQVVLEVLQQRDLLVQLGGEVVQGVCLALVRLGRTKYFFFNLIKYGIHASRDLSDSATANSFLLITRFIMIQ